MRQTFLAFFFLIPIFVFSQKNKKIADSSKFKYNIELDYNALTDKFELNKSLRHKPLKVGSFLYITVKNLPSTHSAKLTGTFDNGNLEYGSMFESVLTRGSKEFLEPRENTSSASNEQDTANKKIEIIELTAIKPNTNLPSGTSPEDSAKLRKINIFDLKAELELGAVKNFLDAPLSKAKSNSNDKKLLENAKEDYEWYRDQAILYTQQNINDLNSSYKDLIKKYAAKIDTLNQMIEKLTPAKTNDKRFMAIQVPNKDFTDLQIEIEGEKDSRKIPLHFSNTGGFKLDFSLGVFNSIFESHTYNIQQADSLKKPNNIRVLIDSVNIINETENSKHNISFGVLAHAYSRMSQFVSIGLSTGFTYVPETKNLSYLIGASGLFGRHQRFVLTTGLSLNSVQELDKFQSGVLYHESILKTTETLSLKKRIKPGYFIGISYNLGLNNARSSINY